jgi:hypothetical protein
VPLRKCTKNKGDHDPSDERDGTCPVKTPAYFFPESGVPGRYAIHTDLTFTNSRIPYSESSRP